MEELLKQPTDILAPKEKEITIYFSDIRSFTTISEKLKDPKKVIEMLNEYFNPMTNIIIKYEGTIDKFIGDAIMAYWNAPHNIKNHADKAVSAAIEQIKLLKELNKKIYEKFNINIDIGIGINTGIATIGEMGSRGRADYSIIGDSVNLASRLEGLCKFYKTHIIISEFTKEKLTKEYIVRELDTVYVKGKNEAITIYEVIDFGKKDFSEYQKALKLYKNAKFKEAKEIFEKLYNKEKEYIYLIYIKRCEEYIKNPPKEFNGVYKFTTK
jgi:adenylate cyclase